MRHAQGKTYHFFSVPYRFRKIHAKTNIRCLLHYYIFNKLIIRQKLICFPLRICRGMIILNTTSKSVPPGKEAVSMPQEKLSSSWHSIEYSHQRSITTPATGLQGSSQVKNTAKTWQAVWTTEFRRCNSYMTRQTLTHLFDLFHHGTSPSSPPRFFRAFSSSFKDDRCQNFRIQEQRKDSTKQFDSIQKQNIMKPFKILIAKASGSTVRHFLLTSF